MKLFNMISRLGMPVKHFQYSEPVSKNSLPLSNPLVMTLQSPVLQYSTDHLTPATVIWQDFCTLTIYMSPCLLMLVHESGKCATKAIMANRSRRLLASIQQHPDFIYTCRLYDYTALSTMH